MRKTIIAVVLHGICPYTSISKLSRNRSLGAQELYCKSSGCFQNGWPLPPAAAVSSRNAAVLIPYTKRDVCPSPNTPLRQPAASGAPGEKPRQTGGEVLLQGPLPALRPDGGDAGGPGRSKVHKKPREALQTAWSASWPCLRKPRSYPIHSTLDVNRERMVAACPQVSRPWGESWLAEVPAMTPAALAQDRAGRAISWTRR